MSELTGQGPRAGQPLIELLAQFHSPKNVMGEEVLARTYAGRQTPYSWLARAVSAHAQLVLDVACGGGWMSRELAKPGRTVIGLDISREALLRAAASSSGPWVQADATKLPFADESLDAVCSAMGLAVIEPASAFLSEVARVLKPGGVFASITLTASPLRSADVPVMARVTQLLRTAPRPPSSLEVITGRLLSSAGLTRAEDRRERYTYQVASRADGEHLIDGFYPGGIDPEQRAAAIDYYLTGGENGSPVAVPIPIRRIVAVK